MTPKLERCEARDPSGTYRVCAKSKGHRGPHRTARGYLWTATARPPRPGIPDGGSCVGRDKFERRVLAVLMDGETEANRIIARVLCRTCPVAADCDDWRYRANELATYPAKGGVVGVWHGRSYGSTREKETP